MLIPLHRIFFIFEVKMVRYVAFRCCPMWHWLEVRSQGGPLCSTRFLESEGERKSRRLGYILAAFGRGWWRGRGNQHTGGFIGSGSGAICHWRDAVPIAGRLAADNEPIASLAASGVSVVYKTRRRIRNVPLTRRSCTEVPISVCLLLVGSQFAAYRFKTSKNSRILPVF